MMIVGSYYFLYFFFKPDLSLQNEEYSEKMEKIHPRYGEFEFIQENSKEGSLIVFLDYLNAELCQSYLYPDRIVERYHYINDSALLEYAFAKKEEVTSLYFYIDYAEYSIFSNQTLFQKIYFDQTKFLALFLGVES